MGTYPNWKVYSNVLKNKKYGANAITKKISADTSQKKSSENSSAKPMKNKFYN